jgi:hypothetical protein
MSTWVATLEQIPVTELLLTYRDVASDMERNRRRKIGRYAYMRTDGPQNGPQLFREPGGKQQPDDVALGG